jgi:GDP-D-mannose dehydratase
MDNIDTLLERGFALDYAEMQKLKLQEEKPDDFVLAATGGQ